ncbi:hypothetical protein Tco_0675803 [Tanacetum coccineum]
MPLELVTIKYADAAAEAIALARAAVKVANSATTMMMNHQTPKPLITKFVPIVHESDNFINDLGSLPLEEDEPTVKQLQLLEEHLSAIIAMRSKRQVESRIRAAKKVTMIGWLESGNHFYGKWTSHRLTLIDEKQATIRAIKSWDEKIYS